MTVIQQAPARARRAPRAGLAKWAPLSVLLCAAIEWVVAGYALTSASLLVTGGRLGDHYGRRRWFAIGVAVFVATSALCALAPDAGFLVAARLGQGMGAAIMAPNVLSIL